MNRTVWALGTIATLAILSAGCAKRETAANGHGHEHASWSVTAWGSRYEIFVEADELAVGETAKLHAHVTVLEGFAPLAKGAVSAILTDGRGSTSSFVQNVPDLPGVYTIEVSPDTLGTYDLTFRVESDHGSEEIRSGRVAVGPSHGQGGGLVSGPPPPVPVPAGPLPAATGEPVGFLKEQQWRIPFATEWARAGSLRPSLTGPARVRAAAGGEAILTAPLDGVVEPSAGLFVGRSVTRGGTVIELRPRSTSGRSLTEIESDARLASERLARLEDLYGAEAVSRAELDRARARAATLQAELDAVRGTGRAVPVRAPLDGRIAEVMVTAGEAVTAGASLARLVRPDPLWVEIGLRPEDAANLAANLAGLVVQRGASEAPLEWGGNAVRLVSRAPEVDRTTGLVSVIVEVRGTGILQSGTAVEAEILLPGRREGIVIPAEAIVDDSGVPVVYVQMEGESFVRREVRLLARQGTRALVEGVGPADRVVTAGAAAIRRAAQMSSGEVEGHVH